MAGLDAFESTTLFFFLVAWWVNPFDNNDISSKVMKKKYRRFKSSLKLSENVFGPVWFVLYTLIAISMWLYFNYAHTEKHEDHHHYYDAVLGLMIANYILNKIWTMLFFSMQNYWLGAIDAVLIFLTGLTIEILMWIHNDGDDKGYIYAAGGLLIPYVLWTLYASILSIEIAIRNKGKTFFGLGTTQMEVIKEGVDPEEGELMIAPPKEVLPPVYVDSEGRIVSGPIRNYRAAGQQRQRRAVRQARGKYTVAPSARGNFRTGGW
jgi:tryptophan-rich sensory protein